MINITTALLLIQLCEGVTDPHRAGRDGEKGIYAMTAGALADANEYAGTSFTLNDIANDERIARAMAVAYLRRYNALTSYEKALRVWNAGHRGYKLGRGRGYWARAVRIANERGLKI